MTENEHSSLKTKLKLAGAMKSCMKRMPVESITVREIAQQAQCSRQTFYRCFEDKYALMNVNVKSTPYRDIHYH